MYEDKGNSVGSVIEKKESEIERVLNSLYLATEKLDSTIISFDSVLINVVRGATIKSNLDSDVALKPSNYSVPLAQTIENQVEKIDGLVKRLYELRNRVEL